MTRRDTWLLGLAALLAAGPACGQPPPKRSAFTASTAAPTAKPPAANLGQGSVPSGVALPHTLGEALAAVYSYQPALQAERAKLRATDENVPQALSGWRPTVVMNGEAGYGDGMSRSYSQQLCTLSSGAECFSNIRTDRTIAVAQATLTQPLYTGGKVSANVNHAKNQVMAERANLIAQEQTSFTNAVTAYVGVIQAQQVLALNINNEQVLAKQLQATNDRFRVGEITRTDVAQAEAALAGATAQREIAEGNLQTARSQYTQVVGFLAPSNLVEPQPLALPVRTQDAASIMAAGNNPTVIAALFTDAAAKDAVDVAFAQLLPQVSFQGQVFQQQNASSRSSDANGYQAVVNLTVPIYQGGAEYSAVRQARQTEQQTHRQVDDARRTAVQTAVQSWETLAAAKASAASTREQIRANEIALVGVEQEALVGSRTTLDVLNAQQALLSSEITLVQNVAQLVTASYQVAAAIGRLTARDLRLPVPLYDETAYYNAVRNKWVGLGDYATSQPGR